MTEHKSDNARRHRPSQPATANDSPSRANAHAGAESPSMASSSQNAGLIRDTLAPSTPLNARPVATQDSGGCQDAGPAAARTARSPSSTEANGAGETDAVPASVDSMTRGCAEQAATGKPGALVLDGCGAAKATGDSPASAAPLETMAASHAATDTTSTSKKPDHDTGEAPAATTLLSWWKSLVTGMLAVCVLLGLILMGQAATIVLAAATLPAPFRYAVYLALLSGLVLLGYLVRKPLWSVMRLRAKRVDTVEALRMLWSSRSTSRESRDKTFHERERIQMQLKQYARNDAELAHRLEALGCHDESVERACAAWKRIVSEQATAITTDSFFERVDEWDTALKGCGSDIVSGYATTVAVASAVSPNPLIDSAIVVVNAVRMVRDLCELYNQRIGGPGAVILTGYLCVQAYAARHGQDIADSAMDTVAKAIRSKTTNPEAYGNAIVDVFGAVGIKVTKKIFSAGAEAGANYLLMRRLGYTVIRYLQFS